jgi:hypothetical protein
MVASVSFVSTGTFNHVFPSLPMHTLLSSKFPRETGKFSWKQRISLSSNFPLHAWWGIFRRQKRTSLPLIGELYLIENHRHNYGQYLTTPSRTHSNNHFASFYSLILNISIVGGMRIYMKYIIAIKQLRIYAFHAYIWKVFVPQP